MQLTLNWYQEAKANLLSTPLKNTCIEFYFDPRSNTHIYTHTDTQQHTATKQQHKYTRFVKKLGVWTICLHLASYTLILLHASFVNSYYPLHSRHFLLIWLDATIKTVFFSIPPIVSVFFKTKWHTERRSGESEAARLEFRRLECSLGLPTIQSVNTFPSFRLGLSTFLSNFALSPI